MVSSTNAMVGVPRSMQTSMPAQMKFDHVGASTHNGNLALDPVAGNGDACALLANSPYSPLYRHIREGTAGLGGSRLTTSNNLAHTSEFAGLYNKGTAIHSEVRVDFANQNSQNANSQPVMVGITPMTIGEWNDSSLFNATADPGATYTTTGIDDLKAVERYGTVYRVLPAHGACTLFNSVAPHKFLGRKDPLSDDELEFEAGDNAIPAEAVVWVIWACPLRPSQDPAEIGMAYSLRTTIIWHNPKNHTRSSTT